MSEEDPETGAFRAGKEAFEQGDFTAALSNLAKEVKAHPANVAAHLLIGSTFVKAGHFLQAFQVWSTLILHPELRGNAELPRAELDDLMVATLLGWGVAIETHGFDDKELALFRAAVNFYGGDRFGGRHTVALLGLDEGLARKMAVSASFAEVIAKQNETGANRQRGK